MIEVCTPQIYAGCLAAYNQGHLHGVWIDCNQDSEDIWLEIQKMLKSSPALDAEEWLIFDFDNWHGIKIDECEDVDRVALLAGLLIEHGEAFAVYYQDCGGGATVKDFSNRYLGQYESEEDFVYEQWSDGGKLAQLEQIGISENYIDWEAIARDWFIDSFHSVDVGYKQVYVFSRR